jgi:hypothetical protein
MCKDSWAMYTEMETLKENQKKLRNKKDYNRNEGYL